VDDYTEYLYPLSYQLALLKIELPRKRLNLSAAADRSSIIGLPAPKAKGIRLVVQLGIIIKVFLRINPFPCQWIKDWDF